MIIVLMGVCGSGKTTVGTKLAERLGAEFIEGDDLHPQASRAKMARGEALTDDDRWPWLKAIAARARAAADRSDHVIVSCSALRRIYREQLKGGRCDVRFVHLTGAEALLADRMARRRGHFMPPGLLASQIATLEPPDADEAALTLDIAEEPDVLADVIVDTYTKARA